MKRKVLLIATSLLILITFGRYKVAFADQNLIKLSRSSCVRINVPSLDSTGTGFFLDSQHVITCFHVIGKYDRIPKTNTTPEEYRNIVTAKFAIVGLPGGERIGADVITLGPDAFKFGSELPNETYKKAIPVYYDFAILKLKNPPRSPFTPAPLFRGEILPNIGSEVLFSGYPLSTQESQIMITHRGIISGISENSEAIAIQAPVYKGDSGGALFNEKGEVIGIVSLREVYNLKELDDLRKKIDDAKLHSQTPMSGLDSFALDLINALDNMISTGIGYASNIKNLVHYLDEYPELLK